MKTAPKAGAKKAAASSAKTAKPAGPGAIAAGGGLDTVGEDVGKDREEPESFAATGLDNALDLLEVVTAKMDKASVGQRAAGLEQHPEVRLGSSNDDAGPDLRIMSLSAEEIQGCFRGVQRKRATERQS